MKLTILHTILLSLLVISIGCKKDESNPAAPSIVASEEWGFIMDNDTLNHGQATFEKKSDGTLSEHALWYFNYQGTTVACPFEGGAVMLADTLFSLTAQGTATNSSAPMGYQTSGFTVNVGGTARNGTASGTWSITFSTLGWPSALEGTFTGTRKSGSGITN